MPLTAPPVVRELVPKGTHLACITDIIDMGTQTDTYDGDPQRKIRLVFELLGVKREWEDQQTKEKKSVNWKIGQDFTWSMGPRANLRKLFDGIKGGMNEQEAEGFDFSEVLGKPCLLSIVHKESKKTGNPYALVASATAVPEGMTVPERESELVILAFEPGYWNQETFNALPDWLKDKIRPTAEYQAWENTDGQAYPEITIPNDPPF